MNTWYVCQLLYRNYINRKPQAIHELTKLLVRGSDYAEASAKAERILRKGRGTYMNAAGEEVAWRPIKVLKVEATDAVRIVDGMEIDCDYFDDMSLFRRWRKKRICTKKKP